MSMPAGWYEDPTDGIGERYWDGEKWTEFARATPESNPPCFDPKSIPSAILGEGGILESLGGETKGFYDRNKGTVQTVAGGALIADGAVGLGKNKNGLFPSLFMMIFGIVFIVIVGGIFSAGSSSYTNPVSTTGTVTEILTTGSGNCAPAYDYTPEGYDHTVGGQGNLYSSGQCGLNVGDPIEIIYDANKPQVSQPADDGAGMIKYVFFLVPGLFVLIGAYGVVTSLLKIGGGTFLLVRGLKNRKAKAEGKTAP